MKQTNVTTHPYFSYKRSLLSRSYIIESWRLYALTPFSFNSSRYEINDLDDPFAYNKKYSAENVSLYPIKCVLSEIEVLNKERDII